MEEQPPCSPRAARNVFRIFNSLQAAALDREKEGEPTAISVRFTKPIGMGGSTQAETRDTSYE